MKIYLADPEPFNLPLTKKVLLSFYDIYISTLPFRKETWKVIKMQSHQKNKGATK